MNTKTLLDPKKPSKAPIALLICLVILIGAALLASLTQRNFGQVEVSNVCYDNFNGIKLRAKLYKPADASASSPMPGTVYIHGYQNNRETGDAYCIELARRGFVVLNIDAIGRGNSGVPNDPDDPDFDETYGGRSSLDYLRQLPYVDPDRVGMMGHSLGAEMAYNVALTDPGVQALVITGFAYNEQASTTTPRNMLMMIGQYDEYRERMTGVDDITAEWMSSAKTQQVIDDTDPQLATTYGDFAAGTARRVFVPKAIHIQVSHSSAAIAEMVEWMRQALRPDPQYWVDSDQQIWHLKEWSTLVAMLAGLASLYPLGLMLLRTKAFRPLVSPAGGKYNASNREFIGHAAVNGLLMWLYLPLIMILFAVHVYLIEIDGLFPMMMTNGTVWWFFGINVIGFFIFRRWFKRHAQEQGLTLADLGISFRPKEFHLDWNKLGKTALLALILFGFAYLCEALLERILIIDYRFIFPFISDLTPYRAALVLLYFPFLLVGFLQTGAFLHGQIRRPKQETWLKTFVSWSISNTLALVIPVALFMLVQYLPLLTAGVIPFVGPGGAMASFTMNLFHIIGVLLMVTPLSTWFYQLTGKIYLGATLNALLVAWMFCSSQVIAPIPV